MGIAGFSLLEKRALWQSSHWVCWAGMAVRFWCVSGFLGYFVVGAGTLAERENVGGKGTGERHIWWIGSLQSK